MILHKHMSLTVIALALTILPIKLNGSTFALADDSEIMDAEPENIQQYGNFPNQNRQLQGEDYQRGWHQGNANQGYWDQNNRINRANNDQEPRASRFSREGRTERGGGGRDGGGRGGDGDND